MVRPRDDSSEHIAIILENFISEKTRDRGTIISAEFGAKSKKDPNAWEKVTIGILKQARIEIESIQEQFNEDGTVTNYNLGKIVKDAIGLRRAMEDVARPILEVAAVVSRIQEAQGGILGITELPTEDYNRLGYDVDTASLSKEITETLNKWVDTIRQIGADEIVGLPVTKEHGIRHFDENSITQLSEVIGDNHTPYPFATADEVGVNHIRYPNDPPPFAFPTQSK